MSKSFFQKFSLLGSALCLLAAGGFMVWGRDRWALGVLVAGAWALVNFYFLFRLIEVGLVRKADPKNRILLYSTLKFPVLYVAGFFILKSRLFPAWSLVAGLTIFMAAFVFHWMRFNVSEGRTA